MNKIEKAESLLKEICTARFHEYYGYNPSLYTRFEYEFGDIHEQKAAPSYLTEYYLVEALKKLRIPTISSHYDFAALIAFLLGISDLDPYRHYLPYELQGGRGPVRSITYALHYPVEDHDLVNNLIGEIFPNYLDNYTLTTPLLSNYVLSHHLIDTYQLDPFLKVLGFCECRDPALSRIKQAWDRTKMPPDKIPLTERHIFKVLAEGNCNHAWVFGEHADRIAPILASMQPESIQDLARVYGLMLSDSWEGGFQTIFEDVNSKTDLICSKEDFFRCLIQHDIGKWQAFFLLGRASRGYRFTPENEEELLQAGVPADVILGLRTMKSGLYPHAHILSLAKTAYRLAWYEEFLKTADITHRE